MSTATEAERAFRTALILKLGSKVGFHREVEFLAEIPHLGVEVLAHGEVMVKLALRNDARVSMQAPMYYSVAEKVPLLTDHCRTTTLVPMWSCYATLVIMALSHRYVLRDISTTNLGVQVLGASPECPKLVFFDAGDWERAEEPMWPLKYTLKSSKPRRTLALWWQCDGQADWKPAAEIPTDAGAPRCAGERWRGLQAPSQPAGQCQERILSRVRCPPRNHLVSKWLAATQQVGVTYLQGEVSSPGHHLVSKWGLL